MKWQPIETAPKDGTEIILGIKLRWNKRSLDKHECRIGTGFYCAGAYWYKNDAKIWRNRVGQHTLNPTHWMPLPDFPMGSTVAGEVANSLGGLDTTCPTCGDSDCIGGLHCETGDGI